jgi:hypothetical protein
MTMRFLQVATLLCVSSTLAFQPVGPSARARTALKNAKGDDDKESSVWNPLQGLSDMLSNFDIDDVVYDFMDKRMGNGEVFYGERRVKPSGRENTEGSYNGMGMSDKVRIDTARERKEELVERRRQAEERKRS